MKTPFLLLKCITAHLLLLALTLISPAAFAQLMPTGFWSGDLNLGGATPHKLTLDFQPKDSGSSKVLVSLPTSGMHDLQAEHIELHNDSLYVIFRDHMASYTISINYSGNNAAMHGIFSVKSVGIKLPLKMEAVNTTLLQPIRPQTPKAPFPYSVMPVAFAGGNEGITLQGTITAPKGKKEVPGVILISGSGPHNRDSEQFYHKTFLVLADELTRKGFAVLRYDERGVGESSGKYGGSFTEDFAGDAAAAVKALQAEKRVKVKDVYVVGHSEGSLMAQIVAAEESAVAGVVLMAAVGLSGVELSKARHRTALRARGMSESEIERAQEVIFQDKAYDIIAAAPDSATARLEFNKWFKEETGTNSKYSSMYIEPYLNPWHFHHLHFDPKPYLSRIKVPVLAISGSNDFQAPVASNLAGIKAGLRAGGNAKFTEVILPNMNHFMQTSVTGAYDEPYTLEETFSPKALNVISNWLVKQAGTAKESKAKKNSKLK